MLSTFCPFRSFGIRYFGIRRYVFRHFVPKPIEKNLECCEMCTAICQNWVVLTRSGTHSEPAHSQKITWFTSFGMHIKKASRMTQICVEFWKRSRNVEHSSIVFVSFNKLQSCWIHLQGHVFVWFHCLHHVSFSHNQIYVHSNFHYL